MWQNEPATQIKKKNGEMSWNIWKFNYSILKPVNYSENNTVIPVTVVKIERF